MVRRKYQPITRIVVQLQIIQERIYLCCEGVVVREMVAVGGSGVPKELKDLPLSFPI